ncbi:MAG TPA: hypothetical protein VKU60_08985, partial [Chloroflexota bacterium]|nr:hypothetical protein [Chloroflexota bacterium]
MALDGIVLKMLLKEHLASPFQDPILTLGRQAVIVTLDFARQILREHGITPVPLPADEPIDDVKYTVFTDQGPTHPMLDHAFFKLLGLTELHAMDVSNYEGADIVADLNQPVDSKFDDHFNAIIDSGTIEHVFNIGQSL